MEGSPNQPVAGELATKVALDLGNERIVGDGLSGLVFLDRLGWDHQLGSQILLRKTLRLQRSNVRNVSLQSPVSFVGEKEGKEGKEGREESEGTRNCTCRACAMATRRSMDT
eukprot:527824-Rhodomonas_salina.1